MTIDRITFPLICFLCLLLLGYDCSQTKNMALKDLIVTNKQVSEDLIENILKGKVELIQDGNKIILTRESSNFSNKVKILLFLVGGKAWELLGGVSLSFSPREIEEALNIPGNSLRPLLKELSDNFFVSNDKGKYQITFKGVYELEAMLKAIAGNGGDGSHNRLHKKTLSKLPKSTKGAALKSGAIDELISDGYFSEPRDNQEILTELGRRGITIKSTSLPSFLLPLVRKRVLTRDHKEKNKRKVWAYKATK